MKNDIEKIKKLSEDVLRLARNTIILNLRFMDAALAELILKPTTDYKGVMTDGATLFYNPADILRFYSRERFSVTRIYMHVLLHCLYRHNLVNGSLNGDLWDLACDITVENIIHELDTPIFYSEREKRQQAVISELRTGVGTLTAERIYRHYLNAELPLGDIARLRVLFAADDHDIWYMPSSYIGILSLLDSDDLMSARVARWSDISSRMQRELESFTKGIGKDSLSLIQNLGEVNRERYDYTGFLKQFAVLGEAMKINDDEFDYIFYTYGLENYGKMPLIEPLEYKDVRRIRDFAIILDTSGSVSGELVQTFVNKTYNILKSCESFFSKMNIYIIQCDCEVQEAVKITSQAEFDEYLQNMKLHGFGGTDFRPAFDYIDKLRESGELENLRGIIYFTDGLGTFPERKPDYDAAFVFIRGERMSFTVPPWAIKLILDKEEFED